MATSTPTRAQTPQATISTPSPGSWRHPRADEIARRQKANTFDDSNLRKIVWNGAALAGLFYASSTYAPPLPHPLQLQLTPRPQILSPLRPPIPPTPHNHPPPPDLPPRPLQHRHRPPPPAHQQRRPHRHPSNPHPALASRPRPQRHSASHARHAVHHAAAIPAQSDAAEYLPRDEECEYVRHAYYGESVVWEGGKCFAVRGAAVAEEGDRAGEEGSGEAVELWFAVAAGAGAVGAAGDAESGGGEGGYGGLE